MRRVALVLLTLGLLLEVLVTGCRVGGPERSAKPQTPPPQPFDAVERFSIDGRPSAITIASGKVFVADDENAQIHVLDEATGKEPDEPVPVEVNPIAIDADEGVVWVGHADGTLTRIDARTLRASKERIGGSITDVIAQDGQLWVIDLEGKSAAEVDPATSEVIRGVSIPAGAVRGAVGHEGLWVSGTESAVSRVELVPFVVRHTYPDIGGGPIGMAWDGKVMWAAMSDDGTVVDVEQKTYEDPVKVGAGPVAMAVFDDGLFVVNQDDATVVEVRKGKVRGKPVDLETSPRDIAAGADALWICGTAADPGKEENSNVVIRVDPEEI